MLSQSSKRNKRENTNIAILIVSQNISHFGCTNIVFAYCKCLYKELEKESKREEVRENGCLMCLYIWMDTSRLALPDIWKQYNVCNVWCNIILIYMILLHTSKN